MMIRRLAKITTLLLLLQSLSCSKEPDRLDNFLVEFATTFKTDRYRFELDNGDILIPLDVGDFNGNAGQRVILNYTPLKDDTISINQVIPIFTGTISYDEIPDIDITDPVKLRSAWVGGNYLNLIIETEYHSIAHALLLNRDTGSPEIKLSLSYSRNNDPPGYPKVMYASFLIDDIRPETGSSPTPFVLIMNTHAGIRQINMELK